MALDLLTTLARLQPNFLLLDAAQGPEVLQFLTSHSTEFQCLYDGQKAFELAPYAPYLTRIPGSQDAFAWLQAFLKSGWGQSWAVFLSSSASLTEVRAHLRRFLYVQNSERKQLYFRFYDPRVLRMFLPTCSAEQLRDFFGPVTQMIAEGAGQTSSLGLQWQTERCR